MPVKFRYEYKRVEIAPEMVRAEFTAAANQWWDDAMLAFVEASQSATPVDTGMSASSFAALADHIDGSGQMISGGPPKKPYVQLWGTGGRSHPDIEKTPELGYSEGQRAYDIVYMSKTHSVLRFNYHYKVYQLALWTEGRNDAWGVKAVGNIAFAESLKQGAATMKQGFVRALRRSIRTRDVK